MTHLTTWLNTRSIAARDAVIEEHTPMIRKMARAKWKGKLFDDFLGAAYLGAIHAMNTYDPNKANIETHMYWKVRSALDSHAKAEKRAMKHYTTLDDDDRNNDVHDTSTSAFDVVSKRQDAQALRAAIKSLPCEDKKIITLRVLDGMTLRNVASTMGLGYSLVIHRERSIIKRMRAVMHEHGAM